jgi:deazaflavin-dependent oxidoreductase (nitroreductase family)
MAKTEGTAPPRELPDWIRDHVRRYVETDGADGHMWDSRVAGGPGPIPTLLLTTVGRRSGRPLTLPLIYERRGDREYVVIASKGGAPQHPAWYTNLVAQPRVRVQVGAERFDATAETCTGELREQLWERLCEIYPPYRDYQQRAKGRQIPVVLLRREDA